MSIRKLPWVMLAGLALASCPLGACAEENHYVAVVSYVGVDNSKHSFVLLLRTSEEFDGRNRLLGHEVFSADPTSNAKVDLSEVLAQARASKAPLSIDPRLTEETMNLLVVRGLRPWLVPRGSAPDWLTERLKLEVSQCPTSNSPLLR